MNRYAAVVEVKPDSVDEYCQLHKETWQEVLNILDNANMHNYSIYLREINKSGIFLFSYFEYTGNDFEKDMALVAANPITQKWWAVCKPCLKPLHGITIEQCWAPMTEVFHKN
jgi:L-rhamnose mutarotase